MKKLKVMFVILSVFTSFMTYADGGRGVYKWPKYEKVEVPDSLNKEKAFFVSNVKTIDYKDFPQTSIVVFQRIYINSEDGAEEFSTRELSLGDEGKLSMISARTVKQDGTEVLLDDDKIIETFSESKDRYGVSKNRLIKLIYPNLEVGDVVDFAYQLDLDYYIISDLGYLEDGLPSLYSRITLRNMTRFDITAYPINNMPQMKSGLVDGIITMTWEKNGVDRITEGYFNAVAPEAPYFVYNLWDRGQSIDYNVIYEHDVFKYPVDFGATKAVTEYFTKKGVITEGEDYMFSLKKIIEDIHKNFSWNYEKSNKAIKGTITFMNNEIVDYVLFQRYIMKFLTEQGVRFERCFTKSLLKGVFVHGFVSFEQLDDRFLLIYDKNNQLHYLFPPTSKSRMYYLDEIPYYCEGNQSIALYGKKDFLDEQAALTLVESRQMDNTHTANVLIKMESSDIDSLSYSIRRKDLLTGHYSYLTRSSSNGYWIEQLNIKTDSIPVKPTRVDNFYPYEVEFDQNDLQLDLMSKVNDSLVWFSPNELLPEGIYFEDENESKWGNYLVLPFLKKNKVAVFIHSNQGVSIAEDDLKLKFVNDIGSAEVTVIQLNGGVLKFIYEIKLDKRIISGKENVEKFETLLQKYLEFRNKKWAVKL